MRCAPRGEEFKLAAVVQHNQQNTLVASTLAGTTQLLSGEHRLQCRVGPGVVQISLGVTAPSKGECMGAGYVVLLDLSFDDRKIGPLTEDFDRVPFNWKACRGGESERMLVSIAVRKYDEGAALDQCTAQDWTWEQGYTDLSCSTELLRP